MGERNSKWATIERSPAKIRTTTHNPKAHRRSKIRTTTHNPKAHRRSKIRTTTNNSKAHHRSKIRITTTSNPTTIAEGLKY